MNMIEVTKAKLIIDGKELEVMINPEELEKLLKPSKKTGYERVEKDFDYFTASSSGGAYCMNGHFDIADKDYEYANYYSDKTVAENNARADKLMRQLRRFAVEHRESEIDWNNPDTRKYGIKYDHKVGAIVADHWWYIRSFGAVWFDSEQAVNLAIKTFRDELIWYFTEYKDSL